MVATIQLFGDGKDEHGAAEAAKEEAIVWNAMGFLH
jgi:hypothetical protein